MNGCCDNGCVIKKPKGMGTNGGCCCSASKLRWRIDEQNNRIKMLEKLSEGIVQYMVFANDAGKAFSEIHNMLQRGGKYPGVQVDKAIQICFDMIHKEPK